MKFKVKNLEQVKKKIQGDISKELKKEKLRRGMAQIYVDYIRSRKNLKAKKATQSIRKYLEKFNSTHPEYRRDLVRFTFTGDLLKDLVKSVRIRRSRENVDIILEHSSKQHRAYKTAGRRRKRSGKGVKTHSYQKIYEFISSISPKYRYLSWKVPKKIQRKMTNFIKTEIVNVYIRKRRKR